MKKTLSILAFLMMALAIPQGARAQFISAVAPTGQTLYYYVSGSNAMVRCPSQSADDPYQGFIEPTGNLEIPASVTYNGTTYTVTSIGVCAFAGCSGLTSVTIPNSVTSIGWGAFELCSGLSSVIIPNSVTMIEGMAFYNCSGLASVTIPSSVTTIDDFVFDSCISLISVTIPNTITSIGACAFCFCSGLTSVTIPNSVTSIGSSAFSDCSGLTSVTIPNSVTSIGNYAFSNCSGLTSVTIGKSISTIGEGAFYSCNNLTTVYFDADSCAGFSWEELHQFDGCTNLSNFVFGDSVRYIPGCCCYGLSSLTSVTIPNTITTIGERAFYRCSGLTSLTIPNSITTIGKSAFSRCSGLTSLTIPNSITTIGKSAFSRCSGLTSVTIPNTVTTIDDFVFDSCSSLTSVAIPNSVTTIGKSAFESCYGLTSVTIPNSVTSIGKDAFFSCSGLISLTIGNTVTSIGRTAFGFCSGLTEITSLATTAPSLEGGVAFMGVSSTIPVNIPCGSLPSYLSQWYGFSNFVEDGSFSFSVQSADEVMGIVSILTQPTCQEPVAVVNATANEGYRFDHWNDGTTDNPYSLTVTQDTTLIAYFVSTQGIGDVDCKDAKVTVANGQIVVENANSNTITLYDAAGRILAIKQSNNQAITFDIPATGTYLVKVGSAPARRVVVVK